MDEMKWHGSPNDKWHISISINTVIKLIRILTGKEKIRWPWQKKYQPLD